MILKTTLTVGLTFLIQILQVVATSNFQFEETTVAKIQVAFDANTLTSVQLVTYYLNQIKLKNEQLHAVVEINQEALTLAAAADEERRLCKKKYGKKCSLPRLHGIPVLLKVSA